MDPTLNLDALTLVGAYDYTWNYFANSPLGIYELVGSALLLLNVYLLTRQSILNFIPGIIGVAIFSVIFYHSNLYADAGLQVFFFVAQFFGFWYWMYGGKKGPDTLEPIMLEHGERIGVLLLTALLAYGMGYGLDNYTDAHFPYFDSAVAAFSVAGQFLLNKKVWDTWICWIIVDLIAIPLYFTKELYVTSGLYVVFLILSLYGLIEWTKQLKDSKPHELQAV